MKINHYTYCFYFINYRYFKRLNKKLFYCRTESSNKENREESTSTVTKLTTVVKSDIDNVTITDLLKINCKEWPWLLVGFIGCTLFGAVMPVFAVFYGQMFSVSKLSFKLHNASIYVFFLQTFMLKGNALLLEASFWSKMFIVLALTSGLASWMQVK